MKRRSLLLASIAAFFANLLGRPTRAKPDCYGGGAIKLGNTRYVWREKTNGWGYAIDEPHWSELTATKIEPYEPSESGTEMEGRNIAIKKEDYAEQEKRDNRIAIIDFKERRFAQLVREKGIDWPSIQAGDSYDLRIGEIFNQLHEEAKEKFGLP